MAGVAGFEPTNARVKVSCLTAWRHPKEKLWGEYRVSNPRPPEPQSGALPAELYPPYGVSEGIRTPDPRLRRAMLYPAELMTQMSNLKYGAGDENRTHATSLEGWRSTIELHPHIKFDYIILTLIFFIVNKFYNFIKINLNFVLLFIAF